MNVAMKLPSLHYDAKNTIFSIISKYCSDEMANADHWDIATSTEPTQPWIHIINPRVASPSQGWKLHISSSVLSAEAVLGQILPILLTETASFKVAASLQVLDYLNQGAGGPTQIGKFVTVYPNDDDQAVRLAIALDRATRERGLRGPAIPSDRPLLPGSLVHYRYGGFGNQLMQTPLGEMLSVIRNSEGILVPDQRRNTYVAPDWVADPFLAAGVVADLPEESMLLAERYLLIAMLHRAPRGAVYLSTDIIATRTCILKQARHDAVVALDGHDACDRLHYEASVLTRLAPSSHFPTPFDLFDHNGDLYLAMEDVAGETLEQHVAQITGQGHLMSGAQIVSWGRELAAILETVHARGFIYRDLKSPNIIIAPEGQLRLLDFEAAYDIKAQAQPFCYGTRGYVSPQQDEGQPPAVTDDVYSLGALLYFMASGCEPSLAPRPFNLLDRPVELLNPTIGPGLVRVIARCLDPDPTHRFPSMAALGAALDEIHGEAVVMAPLFGKMVTGTEDEERQRSRALARRLGDTLCRVARRIPEGRGVAWASTHHSGRGTSSRDINTGSSGAVLALAEVAAAFDDAAHRAIVAEGAQQLMMKPRVEGTPLPGMYVGEAGIGTALLRAGQILRCDEFIAAALERGRWVAEQAYVSPDLFNGTAGRLLFHLLLWDETADLEQLHAAVAAGEALLTTAEDAGDGGLRWTIPPGYDSLSGEAYLGYAHGAAGIGDTLLDLFEVTQDRRFLEAARGAARWLMRLAVPALDDGSGLAWPINERGKVNGAFWCRGATGIGQFLLHAATSGIIAEAAEFAAQAAHTVAYTERGSSPTQCHGLAGNIEFLLDLYQATGEHAYLNEARSLARILEAFGVEQEDGLAWSSEIPTIFSPDYMVGYAGVAVCLLRLSEPEHRPRQLSRHGFRYR